MTTKSSIKYASIGTEHLKNVEIKKSSRKSVGSDGTKHGRRSQSLERLDENSGDSRAERRNRRQYMHLVGVQIEHSDSTLTD